MRPTDVSRRCKPITRLRFEIEIGLVAAYTAMFAILVGLGSLASVGLAIILGIVWAVICVFLWRLYTVRIGNRLNAGIIAVATMTVTENRAYNDPITAGRQLYANRFPKGRLYRPVRSSIRHSILQIQTYFERMTDPVGDITGMRLLNKLGKFFQHLTLRYVTDACISYTFWCHDLEVWQAAGDSVAVYAFNWKRLTKDASEIIVSEIAILLAGTAALSVFFMWLFGLIGIGAYSFYAILLSAMLVSVIKRATLNPFLTGKAILTYVDDAQRTVLTEKLYVQLSHVSPQYRQLLVHADAADQEAAAPAKKSGRTGKPSGKTNREPSAQKKPKK